MPPSLRSSWITAVALLTIGANASADGPTSNAYLDFVRDQARSLRATDAREEPGDHVSPSLRTALGNIPDAACPLDARVLGRFDRDGYRVEKVVFQTLPGVWMTANVYVPDRPGKRPAILMVHGHWKGAKQDPVVQARCIAAAKLGFFVLAVDAFGAGERGIGKPLGEYHGGMTAATLLPVGLTLAGLQVYENDRAVDYLRSRSEVAADQIGITGASGGGNQSMYAGALDDRLRAVVPVCSVGNYQAYLGAGCCLCELVPGALRFAEEGDVLGQIAPRALLVLNATRDVPQFSPAEATKSIDRATKYFRRTEQTDLIRHDLFESGHDYGKPMREAMYGWMAKHLDHEGDGGPIAEPAFVTEDPEVLRCYPGDTRPDDWMTIPRFASVRGRAILEGRDDTVDATQWEAAADLFRASLIEKTFGGFPAAAPLKRHEEANEDETIRQVRFRSEPGIDLIARVEVGSNDTPWAVLLNLEGAAKAEAGADGHRGPTSWLDPGHARPPSDRGISLAGRQRPARPGPQRGRVGTVDWPATAWPMGPRRPPAARCPRPTRHPPDWRGAGRAGRAGGCRGRPPGLAGRHGRNFGQLPR